MKWNLWGVLLIALLFMSCSVCFLIQTKTIHLQIMPPLVSWTFQHQPLINTQKTCLYANLMKVYSQLRFSRIRYVYVFAQLTENNQYTKQNGCRTKIRAITIAIYMTAWCRQMSQAPCLDKYLLKLITTERSSFYTRKEWSSSCSNTNWSLLKSYT